MLWLLNKLQVFRNRTCFHGIDWFNHIDAKTVNCGKNIGKSSGLSLINSGEGKGQCECQCEYGGKKREREDQYLNTHSHARAVLAPPAGLEPATL